MTTLASNGLPAIPLGAVLYQRAVSNVIGVTAATSNNIGWLATNKTQLEVVAQLTGQDPVDMYNFTFQNDGNVKAAVLNIDGTGDVRFQLYDGSGSRIIADNQGTTAQQDSFDQLKKGTLSLKAGKYVIKVTYGKDGDKKLPQNYSFQLGSGTTFTADYRTLASATTIQNTILAGGSLGYNSLSTTAAFLTNYTLGSNNTTNIFALSGLFGTNIFA